MCKISFNFTCTFVNAKSQMPPYSWNHPRVYLRPVFSGLFLYSFTCSYLSRLLFPHSLSPQYAQVFPALSARPRSGCGDFSVSGLRLGSREQGHSETLPEEPSFPLSACHIGLQLLSVVHPGRGGHLSLRHHLPHFTFVSQCVVPI